MLPPPVNYPKASRRKRFVLFAVLAVALAAAVVAVVLLAPNTRRDQGVVVNAASATTAIQGYLDALIKGDDQTVARNNSCGFFDAVKDRRSDMTLANLTSDAFRRQYGAVRVSTIDKIVTWSPTQAQVVHHARHPCWTQSGRSGASRDRPTPRAGP